MVINNILYLQIAFFYRDLIMYIRKIISVFSVAYLNLTLVAKSSLLGIINIIYLIFLLYRQPYATKKMNVHALYEAFLTLFLTISISFSYLSKNECISLFIYHLMNILTAIFIIFSCFQIFKLKIFLLREKLNSLQIVLILLRLFKS